MVDVDVNVEHPRVVLGELQDANYNVIDIAEARSLKLLSMVKTTSPVNGNLTDLVQLGCSLQRCTCVMGSELKEPGKHWAVIAHIEGIKAVGEALHIGGADSLQEVNVVLRVEAAHVMLGGLVWLEDDHLLTETIRQDQAMGQCKAMGLHRVPSSVVEVAHVGVVKIGHSFCHGAGGTRSCCPPAARPPAASPTPASASEPYF
jgi:hypothetical protein